VALHYYYTSPSHWCARLTRYRNCKFHNFARTISRHADGISRYSVPPSAGPLLPLVRLVVYTYVLHLLLISLCFFFSLLALRPQNQRMDGSARGYVTNSWGGYGVILISRDCILPRPPIFREMGKFRQKFDGAPIRQLV